MTVPPPDTGDLYATLTVEPTASTHEIKRAYRRLVRAHHPDVNPHDPDAETRFREASAACEVLCDPDYRALYDRHGADPERLGFDVSAGQAHREWRRAKEASQHEAARTSEGTARVLLTRRQAIDLTGTTSVFLATLEYEQIVSCTEDRFTPDAVERIRLCWTLHRTLGVNLPGIEVALGLLGRLAP